MKEAKSGKASDALEDMNPSTKFKQLHSYNTPPVHLRRSARLREKVTIYKSPFAPTLQDMKIAVSPRPKRTAQKMKKVEEEGDQVDTLGDKMGKLALDESKGKGRLGKKKLDMDMETPTHKTLEPRITRKGRAAPSKSEDIDADSHSEPKLNLEQPILGRTRGETSKLLSSAVNKGDDDDDSQNPAPSAVKHSKAPKGNPKSRPAPPLGSKMTASLAEHNTSKASTKTSSTQSQEQPAQVPSARPNMADFMENLQSLMSWDDQKTLLDVTQKEADILHEQLSKERDDEEEDEILLKMLEMIETYQKLRKIYDEYLEMAEGWGLGVAEESEQSVYEDANE